MSAKVHQGSPGQGWLFSSENNMIFIAYYCMQLLYVIIVRNYCTLLYVIIVGMLTSSSISPNLKNEMQTEPNANNNLS